MLRHDAFDLTGYTRQPSERDVLEDDRMAQLQTAIREALGRGITLVLDRDRFLRRTVDIVAESSGYPAVAAYVRESSTSQLSLVAATEGSPPWLPKWLASNSLDFEEPEVADIAAAIPAPDDELFSAIIPMRMESEAVGYLLVLHVVPGSLSEDELGALGVVGREIAPAVQVAVRHRQMSENSIVDLSTGVYTHAYFLQRLEEELSRAQRTGHSVTIVLVDVVNIEDVERATGYEVADQLLQDLAAGVSTAMRTSDVVARRGRTGLALLLPESDVDGADVTVLRVRDQFDNAASALPDAVYAGSLPAIIAGSATFPIDGQNVSELLLVADQRMLAEVTEQLNPVG